MNLKDLIESDASEILINVDEMAESVQFSDQAGAVSTIVADVQHEPSRTEQRANRRVRIESVLVSATASVFDALETGASVRVDDGAPYSFKDFHERTPGLVTARFERTTTIETGLQQGDL